MWFQSVQAGGFPVFSSLVQTSLHCLSSAVCVCARASEAHLVVGLLVQRDRRVIKGVLDWLPVKDEGIARRGNSTVVAQTHTQETHWAVLVVSDIVLHIPSVRVTA